MQNRRLRHLQGISIRNLNIAPPPNRYRGKTITDDDVPYSLKSPAKRLALNESKALQHSRSSSDLTSAGKELQTAPKKASTSYEKKADERPRPGAMRRRSTLHWTGASPLMRQQKLEDVAETRMVDTWFSIHCKEFTEPIYVSETMNRSMNPSFRFFDLSALGPHIGRASRMTMKLWAKNEKMDEYTILIDIKLHLESLQFIGKDLESFHQPLPENCVLFHLTDGIYTSFTDMPVERHDQDLYLAGAAKTGHVEATSSYDALMRLANLDDCIQDALSTREKLEAQINALLHKYKGPLDTTKQEDVAKEKLAVVKRTNFSERKQVRQLAKKKEELEESFRLRRSAMASGTHSQAAGQSRLDEGGKKRQELSTDLEKAVDKKNGQIRRICEELAVIYPIDPIKNKPLQFSIRGIRLPNSSFDDTNRDDIAAALGFTSHLVHLLSLYLSTPLPYPILSNASTSTIEDPISVAIGQRTFPLHPTNASFKFEYGVFLLNKNIEFLMSKNSLRMLDIRHTLPNLKYLMYVLTAGKGELPARRAGGVRGLIVGRVTPTMSRRGSDDSTTSGVGWTSLNSQLQGPEKKAEKEESRVEPPHASPAKNIPQYRASSFKEAI